MSFRQFGGLQFASKHNAVASYYNTSSNLLVTQNVGQPNSYITFLSDISGNINIYGDLDVSGNINVSGDVDISGNLYVQGDVDISGNLHVQGNIDCSGNGSFDNSIYIYDVSSYSVISENGTNLNLVNYNANGYININPNGQTGITVNNSGQVGIKNVNPQYSLDVTGNLRTTMDASINTLTVGLGGGDVSGNTVVGSGALYSNTTGTNNTALGYQTLYSNTNSFNTAVGFNALYSNTNGYYNNALGYQALSSNTNGVNNNAFGLAALNYCLGSNNSAFGGNAGIDCKTSGSTYNTFLGAFSTFDLSSNTYNSSTAIGYSAIINASNQIVLGTANESVKIPGSYVGIGGNYNPGNGYALDVNGNVYATTYNTPSDYRIKENITQLDGKFVVDNLNPVTYLNNKLDKQDIGLIAHELQEIYPELVNGEKDGEQLQSVNYLGLIPILIKEIQDLKKEIKLVKIELNELKNK
jgi:hypothetical protein